ncbi:hypothetical protein [Endozoicomonas sp. YOMI1]|uniref:hypothetical protein n=1 Tax=Endozoicomonas sp. YOMI1 TaxID=2828739 RepID=UPI00214825FF|nr:hypothetical protein [Endozoicomonas sp. YOMI1]
MKTNNQLSPYNLDTQYSSAARHDGNSAHTVRQTCRRRYECLGKKSTLSDSFASTPPRKSLNNYNPKAVRQVHTFFPSTEKTPHPEHEKLFGMMMPEMEKPALKKKSKEPERPKESPSLKQADEIEISYSELDELFDDDIALPFIPELPDQDYQKFDIKLSQNLRKIREGNEQKAILELKELFTNRAHDFVSPDKEKAAHRFTEFVRRVYQLDKQMPAGMKAKGEIIKHAIDQMTEKMGMLMDDVRTTCISEAFSNPTFKDALEKVESDTDKSLLRRLQALSAFNFMSNEVNALVRDSGVSVPSAPDSRDPGYDSGVDEPDSDNDDKTEPVAGALDRPLTGNKKHNKQDNTETTNKGLTSQLSELERERREAIDKGMEEVDRILEQGRKYLEQSNKKKEEETKPKPVMSKPSTSKPEAKPIASRPPVAKEKPKPVTPAVVTKTYPSIADIRKLKAGMAIADAVLKFVENCKNERERKELDKFLEERCAEKSKTIVSDLNQVKQQAMKPSECVHKFSETVGYRQIAEKITPPSARKLSEIAENEKVPGKDGNIDGTMLHLLKQSVVFPKSWDVKGDPAKWTRREFLAEFEKGASRHSESQRQCVRKYADDILRLFKLKQYPFGWGYDKERKASPADQEFELMATVMYDYFIGKPLFDYRDCKRLELFTDQQRHTFLETLFGSEVISTLKQIVEGAETKTKRPPTSVERARVEHIKSMVIALFHDKPTGGYYLVVGRSDQRQAFPVQVRNPLALECLNQEKGSNCIYKAMGLPVISDNWNAVR